MKQQQHDINLRRTRKKNSPPPSPPPSPPQINIMLLLSQRIGLNFQNEVLLERSIFVDVAAYQINSLT